MAKGERQEHVSVVRPQGSRGEAGSGAAQEAAGRAARWLEPRLRQPPDLVGDLDADLVGVGLLLGDLDGLAEVVDGGIGRTPAS
jgi:hypothetical protein